MSVNARLGARLHDCGHYKASPQIMNVAKELVFDPQLMRRFDVPGPRYTSYPTADRFGFLAQRPRTRRAAAGTHGQRRAAVHLHTHSRSATPSATTARATRS
jgi:hypothetical protein